MRNRLSRTPSCLDNHFRPQAVFYLLADGGLQTGKSLFRRLAKTLSDSQGLEFTTFATHSARNTQPKARPLSPEEAQAVITFWVR